MGMALISGVLAALAAGSSVVCTPGFDAAAFFRLADRVSTDLVHGGSGNPSGAVIGGTIVHKRGAQQSSLRLIRSASVDPCRPKCSAGWKPLFGVPVIDTYGMTEAATQIAANPLARRKLGSVGTVRRGRDRDHGR